MCNPAPSDADDTVTLEVHLPRKVLNGLRTVGEKYNTGVHGVIRHLAHNAVSNPQHSHYSESKAA
jgi:hypothetical protein